MSAAATAIKQFNKISIKPKEGSAVAHMQHLLLGNK
jgi:hypothetical protein